jgi:hypothetical protein
VTDRRHTAGRWDPNDRPVYFLASPPRYDLMARVAQDHPYVLVAVNELRPNASGAVPALDNLLASGVNVLLDSGIFWLTNEHMRAHGITMNEALALHPDEIDGFDTLFDNYVAIATRYADDLWGYIELDQGGRERKIETRARLHDLGLDPMPVYHPLNDGADYLDHLFQGYDRFCMGNVVQADRFARVRLFHALWDRHLGAPPRLLPEHRRPDLPLRLLRQLVVPRDHPVAGVVEGDVDAQRRRVPADVLVGPARS